MRFLTAQLNGQDIDKKSQIKYQEILLSNFRTEWTKSPMLSEYTTC